jgi:predicted PurR-regulated permease PerM
VELQTTHMREISLKTVFQVLALVGLIYALAKIPLALFILFISSLFAVALHPFIEWLTARRIPKGVSIAAVFLVFILFLALLLFSLGSIIISQGQQLVVHFPQYVDLATERLKAIPFLSHQQGNLLQNASGQLNNAFSQSSGLLLSSLGYIASILASVFSIFTILIFTYFFLSEGDYFGQVLHDTLPPTQRATVMRVVAAILHEIGAYVRGQLLVVSITGLFVGLALTILQAPYAYIQGVLVALLDIIPVIGPMIALSIGIIITLGAKLSLVPWVIAVYLAAQQLENGLIFPFVMNRSVKLHGFWILLSIFLMSSLIGAAGVILAVPTAICVKVLIKTYYLDRLQVTSDGEKLARSQNIL